MMKPMLGLTTHLSMPACVHAGRDWALAGAPSTANSTSAAAVENNFDIE
jgi:hypothetical protein